MRLLHRIELKHKIAASVLFLFMVFGIIGYLAYRGNTDNIKNISNLLDNLKLQNSINALKDNVALDYQRCSEIIVQTSEADIEAKWKDHSLVVDQIAEITKDISSISSDEALEIVEIKNVYDNLIVPPYQDIYKLKLKEQLLISEVKDTAQIASIKKLPAEISEQSEAVRSKIRIVQAKLDAVGSKAEQTLMSDLQTLKEQTMGDLNQLLLFYVIACLVATIFLVLLFGLIFGSIKKLKLFIDSLRHGDLNHHVNITSKDEVGEMAASMNTFVDSIKDIALQLDEIGNANFSGQYTLLGEKDELGMAFLKMKQNLQKANEQAEKLRDLEKIQNWATTGVAKFGEILRTQTESNKELGYNIIKGLIEYLNANQGGVFITNNEHGEQVLQLMATYAYGRRKFKEQEIRFGVGLVGTCAVEGQTIYMTNIPDDYISIESYLGSANPRALLLVPLKLDNKIFGVLEIASFNEFKDYEIKFVVDLAETIASTISTAQINAKTAELLEKSKIQSETMLAQEEEMRQNLEELQSTQEEAHRREKMLYEELEETKRELLRLKRKHGED